MELTFCEMREKVVFNVIDGKRLGRIIDMAFTNCGQIMGIIVPGDKKLIKCINSDDNIFIPWRYIVKIGEDAILVKLTSDGSVLLGESSCGKNCN